MLKVNVTSQNEQVVIQSAKSLDERILQALETGLARGLLITVGVVQREFIQDGPRVKGEFGPGARLHSVTGRLRQGMQSSAKRQRNDLVVGRIGNNVKYAAFHEFGFHGVMNVRAHTRVVDQSFDGYTDSVRGTRKSAVSATGEFIGFTESRKRAASRQRTGLVTVQFVKAHQRRVNYQGKPFVRPALMQQTPVIKQELLKELAKV